VQSLIPGKRYFTLFKIFQKSNRKLNRIFLNDKGKILTDKELELLVEKKYGETRKRLDVWLFWGIGVLWGLLFLISTVSSIIRIYAYFQNIP